MTNLTHSYSAIKMYDNCPKRYNMQRITKEVKDVQGEASLYGCLLYTSDAADE